ncbi:glycoside hydrolase family 20 protein [Boletus reticuloceps]|uniref:beta-N-acetylhexosaminidase n=1 Tax=Boletus reticuloceps TaxID=495285 RepID=A0A8I2YIW8_9AGAM|nr:glycoside hydrolase family 20 protein [Boletus reticuloceps]
MASHLSSNHVKFKPHVTDHPETSNESTYRFSSNPPIWLSWFLGVVLLAPGLRAAGHQPQIPSLQSFYPSDQLGQVFILSSETDIFVDEIYAFDSGSHSNGPTLLDFAETFRSDLIHMTSFALPPVKVTPFSQAHLDGSGSAIVLTLSSSSNHTLYSGIPTPEAYDFLVSNSSYVISGSGPIGAWWGTRTLLQQLALSEQGYNATYTFPAGIGTDSPGWEVRGFMLDAGRHWYTTEFLAEVCTYASFFKINEFHIHASDNLWIPSLLYGPDWRSLYSGFRFEPPQDSPIAGLVPYRNESWSSTSFADLQTHCAQRGVTIVPEIDTPGHSLVISQWRPQLMLNGTPDSLNLSYPETIPTIHSIWSQFLPWFSSTEVSIGADEYLPSLADQYISFVNEMSSYIGGISGKSIRAWGTYEPSNTSSVSTNVTIQHWDFPSASIPRDLLHSGYRVINSEQTFLYLDGKFPGEGGFPQTLNIPLLFSGATAEGDGWAPHIFSANDPANNTAYNTVGLRGAIFALWNDWGTNATTPLETYYQLSQSLAVFAEKTWAGSGIRASELTMEQFEAAYPPLNARAPGQNLNRAVKNKTSGDVVFAFEKLPSLPFHTGVESVGPPYTFSFSVRPSASDVQTTGDITVAELFMGTDSALFASSLTFSSNAEYYPLPPAFQLKPDIWTNVTIQATREYTLASVVQEGGHSEAYWYQTTLNIWGDYLTQANMSFAAPSATIGSEGFRGDIANVMLRID